MKTFIQEYRFILIILLILAIIAVFLMCSSQTIPQNIGISLFVNILTTALTVLIIDRLYQNIEKRKKQPMILAAYQDISLFMNRSITFWNSAFKDCNITPTLKDGIFFSAESFKILYQTLNLGQIPNVTPKRTWDTWLIHNAQEFIESGSKIILRHVSVISPDIYKSIHALIESASFSSITMIPAIKSSDREYSFHRNNTLSSYAIPFKDNDINEFIAIQKWCQKQYDELHKIYPNIRTVTKIK